MYYASLIYSYYFDKKGDSLMSILSFILYCFIVTATPGPAVVMILSTVNNSGTGKGFEFTLGVTVAFASLIFSSVFIGNALLDSFPWIITLMQATGASYMLYLAWKIYNMKFSENTDKSGSSDLSGKGTFISAVLMQYLNPKVVIFTLTVLPAFVMPFYKSVSVQLLFAAAVTCIGFVSCILWVAFGTVFRNVMIKYRTALNRIMAFFLAYSAVTVSGAADIIKGYFSG